MGKRAATGRGRGRGRRSPSRRDRARRRPLGPLLVLGLLVGVLSIGGGAALAHWRSGGTGTGAASAAPSQTPRAEPLTSPETSPENSPEADPKPSVAASPRPGVTVSPKASPKASGPPDVPASAEGTFTAAQATGAAAGTGTLRRYKVEVEDGIDLSARQAAAEIEDILAHPRGWAAHGRGRFQLVSSDADFVIRIATPATADRLCLAQGLNTRGELNCETVEGVVVNLKRWMLGSPTFAGTPAEYRHLIINHEVGHEIGIRRHMGCPGPGRPAPVMMQQIKGLNGCVSNAWPYDEDGTYLTGPPV
ncbi:DUF3152 domain-containing protein [Streptomyces sp. PKU-EA00015]|uniref:DUF3152 domain-containing protein n=1 Tax=Streptomyces sp. PKU-EA00015 TaxID=2748326 RepID=UPI00210B1D3D|nr:DUF3152 domain-containing protein [Streptomyces sp. PKU-EA00015]